MQRIVDPFTVGAAEVGQYRLMKTPAAVVVSAADTDDCVGITQTGAAANSTVGLCILGPTKAIASGVINYGVKLAPDSDGRVKTAASGDKIIGVSRQAASADGDIIDILFNPGNNVLA